MNAPLAGTRVVEIGGGVAVAHCGHLLAGYGADVIAVGPTELDEDAEAFYGRGKQHAQLDELDAILATTDVVLDARPSGTPKAHRALFDAHPELLVVSITPFGTTGPHADWQATNIVAFASGGVMAVTGDRDRAPLQTAGDQAFTAAGLHAFAATTIALAGVLEQGRGEHVDISVQECGITMLEHYACTWEYDGVLMQRSGNVHSAQWGLYETADGWAGLFCLNRQIPDLFDLIGDPALADERFTDPLLRLENDDELFARVLSYMWAQRCADLLDAGVKLQIPIGAVRTLSEVAAADDRGLFDPDGLPGRLARGLPWVAR